MKQFLLCLGAGIPFGIWSYIMQKSGIQNPALTATLLLAGSLIPFIPIMSVNPMLKPGISLTWALSIALCAVLIHGIGHRFYQYMLVTNGRDGVNLAQANITMFMVMLVTILFGNFFILGEQFTLKKGFAVLTAIATILLYQ